MKFFSSNCANSFSFLFFSFLFFFFFLFVVVVFVALKQKEKLIQEGKEVIKVGSQFFNENEDAAIDYLEGFFFFSTYLLLLFSYILIFSLSCLSSARQHQNLSKQ
jgi:ABC-type antimicrobial peptide transport system permease subunit